MTGTSVKDVGLVMNTVTASQGANAKGVSQGDFQKVWNDQSGKGKPDDTAKDKQTTVRKTPGDSLKAREEHRLRTRETQPEEIAEEPVEEWSPEQLEEAMAVLETAAAGLIQQVAESFDMSVEEVQGAMEELELEPLDVLEPGQLGELLLKVGGAEDSYALVTNEELYNTYQTLMEQLKDVVQDVGEELNLDEGQLAEILQELPEQPMAAEAEEPVQQVSSVENTVPDREQSVQTTGDTQIVTPEAVSEPEEKTQPETDSGNEGKEQQHHAADKGETSNVFLQNLKTEQFQPEVQQTAQSTSVWNTDTQDIMRQIMDYMRIQVKSDMSDLEMQLHPQSLGTLQIHVASKGGVVTANFITQNEAVKAALESQMVQLQQNFEEQGIKVNAIEVTVQTHTFERNLDQGRGNNQNQEPAKRNRIRRINLNDSLTMEEMEQEDALAADMMAAGGGTVDYTA